MSNIHEPYLTACQLALWHGLRRGKVCHLELTDIDFSNNVIKIQKKPHLSWNPKNETSIRTIPIHPKIKNYLNKRYIQAKKSKSKFICFFEESGKELAENALSTMFIILKKKINTKHKRKILSDNFSFHSLRHKFVTTLINSGQPMKKISAIVGHASIAMTERMYYHYTDEEKLVTISNLSFGRSIENTLK